MKFTNILEDILGHKSKIKILRYLISSKLELAGREISRVIGIHHRTCHAALKELASFGVVVMRRSGAAIAYKLNDNNLLVKEILIPIFALEKDLLPRVISLILKDVHIRVISAIVFGSVSASRERGTSDVDVLFLVLSKKDQAALIEKFEKVEYDFILKYGNMFSPLVLTKHEFYRRLKHKDRLMRNIIQKGKAVYGKTIQEVLIECRRSR